MIMQYLLLSAGLFSPTRDLDRFKIYFEMSRKTFNYVCSLVMEPMSKSKTYKFQNGDVMSLHDKVAIAIRRLKFGKSLVSIGKEIKAHWSTVSQVTWSFVEALEENGLRHLQWPDSEEDMSYIKAKFESLQGLPNCCGAIDITHFQIRACLSPLKNAVWLDKMNNQSMVLQAIVDPDMRFRDIVGGYPGRMTESSVLGNSTFLKLCDKEHRLNGNKIKLSDGTELNEYIVGDSGFPSLQWLVTPYQGEQISEREAEFNKRHFETWNVAPRALARLKEEWKVLQKVMRKPDMHKFPRIILACCILYNIVIDMNSDEMHHNLSLSYEHDPGYLQEIAESGDKTSTHTREKLSLYLSGKVEQQVEHASEYQTV